MHSTFIISKLIDIFGQSNVLTDQESKNRYGQDLSRSYLVNALAVVFPLTEKEILTLVNLANEYSIGLVPSGGRTGYSGGAVAISGEILVSFEKMNKIISFNRQDKTIKCEPGLITKELQDFAKAQDLFYPVDFASSGSSQIGGNIATNAGGIKVIRYGLTRHWVAGLKIVTGNGHVLNLNHGLIKNACGYDLLQLFIGSEGTLGFITEATIRLIETPSPSKVVLFSVKEKEILIKLLNIFGKIKYITAFEFFSDKALNYVLSDLNEQNPFENQSNFYILLEYDSSTANDQLALGLSTQCLSDKLIDDAIFSESMDQQNKLWKLRENISSALRKYCPYKYDIAVVPSKISEFMKEIDKSFNDFFHNFEIIWFGHVGDGNLHLNVLKPDNMNLDTFLKYCEKMSKKIYHIVGKFKGSISAEHGVGLLKKEFLEYSLDEHEIAYKKNIKAVFDKNGIMNPSKIF